MKKCISALLALSMVLLLSACGGQGQPQESSGSLSSDPPKNSQSDDTQELIDSITAETAEAKGVCGADLYWYYQDNVLVIKGTGEMTEYQDSKSVPWYDYISSIGKVIIDEGCTTISPFFLCGDGGNNNLSSVITPNSLICIGGSAFAECANLQKVVLGDSIEEIGERAFWRCSKLESIELPDSLQKIEHYAFSDCNLNQVNIPAGLVEFDASAFESNNTTEFTVDEANPNYTTIDGIIFSKDLKELVAYPSAKGETYNIPSGTEIIKKYAFCSTHLSQVEIPNTVEKIEDNAFARNYLSNIELPTSIIEIGEAAFVASGLESIIIPESVTKIDSLAFDSIKNVTFLGDAPDMSDGRVLGIYQGETTVYYSGSGFEPYIEDWNQHYFVGQTTVNWIKQ